MHYSLRTVLMYLQKVRTYESIYVRGGSDRYFMEAFTLRYVDPVKGPFGRTVGYQINDKGRALLFGENPIE